MLFCQTIVLRTNNQTGSRRRETHRGVRCQRQNHTPHAPDHHPATHRGVHQVRRYVPLHARHGAVSLATPSPPGGQWEKKVLYQNRPPGRYIPAQALGFSRAEVRGCELLRVEPWIGKIPEERENRKAMRSWLPTPNQAARVGHANRAGILAQHTSVTLRKL